MRAQRDRPLAHAQGPLDDLAGRLGRRGVGVLRDRRLQLQVQPRGPAVGGHGVAAALPRAADGPPHAVGRQDRREGAGAGPPVVAGQRARGLVLLGGALLGPVPHRALDGARVPHEHQGPGVELVVLPQVDQRAQQVAVDGVVEALAGLLDPHPLHAVDLRARGPGDAAAGRERGRAPVQLARRPVAHLLAGPVAEPVPDGLQRLLQAHLDAGLLGHLAHRAGAQRLAALELALGEGPVVVARPVDEQDLEVPALLPPHQRPGGAHDPPAGSGHGSPPLLPLILTSELSGPIPPGPVPPGPTARRALSPGS